jgi:hypothetical protein
MNRAERFWSKVRQADIEDCWEWMASTCNSGYGQFGDKIHSRWTMRLAHRVAYELVYGSVPGHLLVCHRCDNKLCCNPLHMFLGTHTDNALDMRRKGRQVSPARLSFLTRGERGGRAILTEVAVMDIRARVRDGERRADVATSYGVCKETVDAAVTKRTWSHVPD